MKLDKVGTDFIRNQEQLKMTAYKDSVGKWTILWGFTINPFTGVAIKEGDSVPDMTTAEQWWVKLISDWEVSVTNTLRVPINISTLSQNSFNACVSLAWNIGKEAFASSTLAKYINNTVHVTSIQIQDANTYAAVQQYIKSGIAYWFLVWHMADGEPSADLITRRKAEIKLYFS